MVFEIFTSNLCLSTRKLLHSALFAYYAQNKSYFSWDTMYIIAFYGLLYDISMQLQNVYRFWDI